MVLAESFARIHSQNLVNYGVVPARFTAEADYDRLEQGDSVVLEGLHRQLERGDGRLVARVDGKGEIALAHDLSPRQVAVLVAGGLINWKRGRDAG